MVEDRMDVSPSMKLEVYPNRDSTVFMEKLGMKDCETFIRGTFRFKGFSSVSKTGLIFCRLSLLSMISA